MAVTNIQYGFSWAQNFNGLDTHSVTLQIPNVSVYCEIALHSTWAAGKPHHASDAFITQIVSAPFGVEDFPTENVSNGNLITSVFRSKVTSVTFKISAYNSKTMARWTVLHWS